MRSKKERREKLLADLPLFAKSHHLEELAKVSICKRYMDATTEG